MQLLYHLVHLAECLESQYKTYKQTYFSLDNNKTIKYTRYDVIDAVYASYPVFES
jgi:hypothetical protein